MKLFSPLRSPLSFSANDTLLPVDIAAKGVEHGGDDTRLACLRSQLRSGKRITVAALGGSISAGSSYSVRYGGTAAWLYHSKVAQALNTAYPSRSGPHDHHNGALPATGPAFFEHCVEGQLPAPTSPAMAAASSRLVLVEFGVNTDGDPAAFERLLRKLLELRPPVAVLVVNTHVWTMKGRHRTCWRGLKRSGISMDEPEQRAEQTWQDRFNFGDEDAIATICRHYDVPLVSMRSSLLEAVRTGTDPRLAVRHFMVDCKHPSGQGHTYLAQLALWRLMHAPGGATQASAGEVCAASSTRVRQLPPPYHSNGWPRGVSRCVNGERLRGLSSLSSKGFNFTDEGRGKFGWVGHAAGDEISFCLLDTPGGGRVGAAGSSEARWMPAAASQPVAPGAMPSAEPCADGLRPIPGHPTVAARRSYCAEMRSFCGHYGVHAKLINQCPLSCGMCTPATAEGLPSQVESGGMRKYERRTSTAPAVDQSPEGLHAALWLGYLQSYEHMGRATVRCTGGCACALSEIDAHIQPSKERPATSITAVRRVALRFASAANESDGVMVTSSCCRLTVRIDEATSSGERKFKVLAVLLAETKPSDHWQPPGTKVNAGWALDIMHRPMGKEDDKPMAALPKKGQRSKGGGDGVTRQRRRSATVSEG